MEARLVDLVAGSLDKGIVVFLEVPEGSPMVGRGSDADLNVYNDIKTSDEKPLGLTPESEASYKSSIATVSREHFVLSWKEGKLRVADYSSRGGTYVNEKKLFTGAEPAVLNEGDKIKAGRHVWQVQYVAQPSVDTEEINVID